ncbi:MAG: PAS domain-containing protein [Mediterranea sp.]|jgi:PAS domain S-box-containing protein|nr:PAS domain-containing protein [Mediterranea sp.]
MRKSLLFCTLVFGTLSPLQAQEGGDGPAVNEVILSTIQRYNLPIIILGAVFTAVIVSFLLYKLRKQKLEQRKLTRELLEKILDNLPIATKVKDVSHDMRYVFWNKEAERLFEYPARRSTGKTDFEVMRDTAQMIREEDEELLRTGVQQWDTRHFFNRKNQERFTFQNNSLVQLSNGRKWIVFSAWDITKFKNLERKLRIAKEKAEESNRLKSAFLANMSHEIRTPLNAIVGFSSLLVAQAGPEGEEYGRIIESSNEMLLQLISDILDLSKMEAGTLEYIYGNYDVNQILTDIVQTAIFQNKNPELEVRLELPLPELVLYTDERRFMQVLTNFVNNALKFTPQGSVTVGYDLPEEKFVRFYVTDTGIGIPEEKQGSVFDRFVKLNSFKQGTGLGLAISQTIIKELKGDIGLTSTYGEGSTFWCTLPNKRLLAHQSVSVANTPV